MNDVETRMRDAFAARAAAVTAEPDAYTEIARRRERRQALRWARPVAALAATVALVGLGVVVARPLGRTAVPLGSTAGSG